MLMFVLVCTCLVFICLGSVGPINMPMFALPVVPNYLFFRHFQQGIFLKIVFIPASNARYLKSKMPRFIKKGT
jgi:hypothetical protein